MATSSIVLITNGRHRGGTEDHVLQVGDGLVRRGFRVGAVVARRPDLQWLAEGLSDAGVEVTLLDERGGGKLAPVKRVLALRKALLPYRGGLMHLQFNGHPSGELTMLAAKLAGIGRIVRTDHNPPISNPSRGEKASLWFRDRLLSKLILISEQDRRLYQEKLHRDARKMVVIPHGIDPESFQRPDPVALRESLGIKPDETVIGNIANLGELKGTSMFIEMARILHSSNPGLRFLIVGGGEGLERFRARAAEAGLGDRIIFTGHVPKASVPDYFALLDVFVLASLVESGPYTLLEAMASGLPLVATKVGFVSQVVQPELTGLVVAPGDPAALAAGVTRLLTDTIAAERMGREARKSIAEHYSTDTMVDRIAQVYESVGVVA